MAQELSDPASTRLPVWLLGFGTFCNGSLSGALVVTVPQLLAARGVPEIQIAAITGISFIPGIFSFLLAPILDVGLSRRTYAVALGILMAMGVAVCMTSLGDLRVVAISMFAANIAYYLFTPALAGWVGQLVKRADEPMLGAWLVAASIAGFGFMSAVAIVLVRTLPYSVGVGLVCLTGLTPLLLFPFIPHEPTPTLRLSESFGPLRSTILATVTSKDSLRLIALFASPCAAFALTNTLSGLGKDFHASEAFVGLIGGLGVTVGGVFGALIAPRLTTRFKPISLYIAIGLGGAVFTTLMMLQRASPTVFAIATIGENVFQSAAFAIVNALILLSIGANNPAASSRFAILNAASIVPITYMQFADGKGYDLGRLTGALATDAALSAAACVVMGLLFRTVWARTAEAEDV